MPIVTGNGGSISLLGPFTINFDTAGFVNPNDNGIETIAIPAGSLVLDVIPITTSVWKATGNFDVEAHDQFVVSVLASPSGSGPPFGDWQLSGAPDAPAVALGANYIQDAGLNGGSIEAIDWTSQKKPVLAVADCFLVAAAFINEVALVAGSLNLYALVIAT